MVQPYRGTIPGSDRESDGSRSNARPLLNCLCWRYADWGYLVGAGRGFLGIKVVMQRLLTPHEGEG